MAWATTLPAGSTVITSRDTSRAARMLKRAAMAGLNSTGVSVHDLEVATVPVTRMAARRAGIAGGLTVRLIAGDPDAVIIRFFDDEGVDLDENRQRKIDRIFGREDFRRVMPSEIGDIGFPPRALDNYAASLAEAIDLDAVQKHPVKVVIDYSYGSTSAVMPGVLSKVGAEVLAVNPYASTPGALAFDDATHVAQVADLVRASGASIGAVLDPDGEHLRLVDDDGRVLDDQQLMFAFVELVSRLDEGPVALPVGAPTAAAEMVEANDTTVEWVKMSTAALQASALEAGRGVAVSLDGGVIFPEFLPGFDASFALVKMLELLARAETPLSTLVDELPAAYVAHEVVATAWEDKGLVMRRLMEHAAEAETVLIDGVKVVHSDGWALVLPDPEHPSTNIWAEGPSGRDARRRLQEYVRLIRQALR
jgi:mannose-1-phosphate guanylyltransferase/phosphomannomutase